MSMTYDIYDWSIIEHGNAWGKRPISTHEHGETGKTAEIWPKLYGSSNQTFKENNRKSGLQASTSWIQKLWSLETFDYKYYYRICTKWYIMIHLSTGKGTVGYHVMLLHNLQATIPRFGPWVRQARPDFETEWSKLPALSQVRVGLTNAFWSLWGFSFIRCYTIYHHIAISCWERLSPVNPSIHQASGKGHLYVPWCVFQGFPRCQHLNQPSKRTNPCDVIHITWVSSGRPAHLPWWFMSTNHGHSKAILVGGLNPSEKY